MRPLLVPILMCTLLTTTVLAQSPGQAVEYELLIDCPGVAGGGSVTGCPIRAVDGQDAMGDPAIAVDPDIPDHIIISSLHGSGDNGGAPSPKSRSGQAFTTFTSVNHGASWFDSPFTPPGRVGFNAYGQHPQVAIDAYGHVFVGSLYAAPGFPEGRYDYTIAAQKFSSILDIRENQFGQGDFNAKYLPTVYPGNSISQYWYLYDPITDNVSVVWNEHRTPFSDPIQYAPEPSTSALSLFQQQNSTDEDAPRSIIAMRWSVADARADYQPETPRQVDDNAIGPCDSSTNPVLSEGRIYIGCVVGNTSVEGPLPWNEDAEEGDIEMFRINPENGEPEYAGSSPFSGGSPKLGVRSDGRIALMTTDVEEGELRLDAVYGQYDPGPEVIKWGQVKKYADRLAPPPLGATLVASNIQDMIYREYSGVIHMVFKQRYEFTDPLNPQGTRPVLDKAVVAVDEQHGLLAELEVIIGDPVVRAQDPTLAVQSDDVFDDLADDFLELPPAPYIYDGKSLGDLYQREFFAIGDYGTVLFAEVLEITNLRGPGVPPLPNPPPPPIPAPAPASTTAVAGALTVSALVAGSAVTAKKKSVVKAGKKRP